MAIAFGQNRLLAAATVNAPGHHIATRRLIDDPHGMLAAQGFDPEVVAKAAAVT